MYFAAVKNGGKDAIISMIFGGFPKADRTRGGV
jgi:hypothetical protein